MPAPESVKHLNMRAETMLEKVLIKNRSRFVMLSAVL